MQKITLNNKIKGFEIEFKSKRQIRIQIETLINSKLQKMFQIMNVPVYYFQTQQFPQNDFRNIFISYPPFQSTQIGFAPFQIPENKQCSATSQIEKKFHKPSFDQSIQSNYDSDCQAPKFTKIRKGIYRKYTPQQKLRAVEMLKFGKDLKSVSKLLNIPRRNLLRWRKNGCFRKKGGGRSSDQKMQDAVNELIKEGVLLNEKQIREQAKKLCRIQSFKASKGWFIKFCRRYKIRYHSINNVQKLQI